MAQQQLVKEETSLGDLFSDLAEQSGKLIRQEVALAKAELSEKAADAGKNVGLLAAAAFIGYAGVMVLVAALVIILAYVIPLWASALLVGVVLLGLAALLGGPALTALKKTTWAPQETIESVKEDAEWLKKQI